MKGMKTRGKWPVGRLQEFLKMEETFMSRGLAIFRMYSYLLVFAFLLVPIQAVSAEVAVIKSHDLPPHNQAVKGFLSTTRASVSEYQLMGDTQGDAGIVNKVRRSRPDVILAVGAKAASLAKENLSETPMVYCVVIAPEKYGFTVGKMTGIAMEVPVKEQFRVFKSTIPTLKHIGVVYDPSKTEGLIRLARQEAQALGIEVIAVKISHPKELPGAIRRLLPQVQGFWMVPDSTVMTTDSIQFILLATLQENIPFMAFSSALVKSGALLSLSPDYFTIGKQSSSLIDKIRMNPNFVRGGIVYPEETHFSINLKTARILGIDISNEVLSQADEVFK